MIFTMMFTIIFTMIFTSPHRNDDFLGLPINGHVMARLKYLEHQ